ncbi:MAG: hypothetical protein ACRC63_02460, partial [Metamycoplasmataceae bacterium]
MKKNMKKMALGVIASGGFLVPLAVVASCGSSATEEVTNFEYSVKSTPNKIWISDIRNEKYKDPKTLAKVFEGINDSDLENINIELESNVAEVSKQNRIILTANNGYSIMGQKSIRSAEFNILPTEFYISPKTEAPNNITSWEIINNKDDIEFLIKLFNGIEEDDLDNIDVEITPRADINSPSYYVTL